MRLHGQRVLIGAADGELLAKILGGLDHAAGHRKVLATRRHSGPRKSVGEGDRLGLDAPPHAGRVELGLAHTFDAACQNQVVAAGLHLHARLQYCL